MKLIQYNHYKGIFNPKHLEDLREECKVDIGKEMVVEVGWKADKEYCTGNYVGQWVLIPLEGSITHLSFPEEDFELLDKVNKK